MNRFETLMAPTCCSTKELGMIANALEGVSAQDKHQYRTDLLVPKIRLYDELTTVRIEETYEGADNGYALFCQSLTRSDAEPIPIAYAGAWFMALLKVNGTSAFTADTEAATLVSAAGASDPWVLQGAAAIARHVAINAETTQLTQAKSAWKIALGYYEQFFRVQTVEDCHAYKMGNDPAKKQECSEVWDRFLRMQAEETTQRLQAYVKAGDTAGINNAIGVLDMPAMKKYNPGLFERTLAKLTLPYKNAIQSAFTLKDASKLYANCPAVIKKNDTNSELQIAMLEALRRECGRVGKGHGEFDEILQWCEELDVCSLTTGHSALLMAGAKSFFEECAKQIRNQINEDEYCITEEQSRSLCRIMPKDFVIAHQPDGKTITAVQIYLRTEVAETVQKSRASTETGYTTLGKKIWTMISEGTDDEEHRGFLVSLALGELMKADTEKNNIRAFLTPFPDSIPLGSDQFETVGDLKKALSATEKRDLSVVIEEAIGDNSYWDTNDSYNAGEKVWGIIEKATSDRDQQSTVAMYAFNEFCKRTDEQDNLFAFLLAFPSDLPVKGIDGVNTICDLRGALLRASQQESGSSEYVGSPYELDIPSLGTRTSSTDSGSEDPVLEVKESFLSKIGSFFRTVFGGILKFLIANLVWLFPWFIISLLDGYPTLQGIFGIVYILFLIVIILISRKKKR